MVNNQLTYTHILYFEFDLEELKKKKNFDGGSKVGSHTQTHILISKFGLTITWNVKKA